MEHFARWIVKRRKLILVLAVLLLIPSVFGALGTYINYDILTYLPKNLDSMIGETYLEDDFNMASVSMITVENMSTPDTLKLKSDLEGVEGVQKVMWTSDFIDVTTPKEMLPSDIQKFFYNDSGATMLIVQFDAPSADARTMNAQKQIKNILNKDCFIGGMSAILEDTKSLINKEMPLYILCAVGASACCSQSSITSARTFSSAKSATLRKHWQRSCSLVLRWTSPSSCCTVTKKKS